MIRHLYNFWRNILRKDRLDCELEQEVGSYLDLLIEEKMLSGMSRAEALRQARQELAAILFT